MRMLRRKVHAALHVVRHQSIAMKITAAYAAILFIVLMLSSSLLALGVYVSFYHQAETIIEVSKEHLANWFESSQDFSELENEDSPVIPGVIIRVLDDEGNNIFENDHRFPSLATIEKHENRRPPFWANQKMRVVDFGRISLYHDVMHLSANGKNYDVHLFSMITGEGDFLEQLRWALLCLMSIFFLIALATGYFMSKHVLRPIREFIKTAKKIEVENLSARLSIPPVHDDVAELARTFNHMLSRLEAGFLQQRQFVSDASHELRTPVTVILGYSDLLSRWGRKDESVLEEGIMSIRTEAENMQQLIERLLFLARTDQNRQVCHCEEVRLDELLEDVMRRMAVVAKNHTVRLIKNAPGVVRGDPVLLRQMMRIFLDNAIKYTPDGGHIEVSSERIGELFELRFADDGIGIAEEDKEKIFQRFYRVESSRTKEKGGTGLGLPIAKWIAQKHNVELCIESELGKGTTIVLRIPIAYEKI